MSLNQIFEIFRSTFTLDKRALSLMRIAVALLLLTDLSIRLENFHMFYTEKGVLPLHFLLQNNWNPSFFSFYVFSPKIGWTIILFVLQYCFAFALLIGYHTRYVTIFSWILLLSLHNRNPTILQSGDDLLRLLLFWSIFLPWGDYYSIDNKKRTRNSTLLFSAATIAYVLQIIFVFFFSALLKDSAEWRSEGSAIYYALSLDQMVLPLGKIIYPYPLLLKTGTWIVFYLELLLPFLLLIPVRITLMKSIFIIISALFYLSIALTLFVGLFFLIGMVSLIGLLPSNFCDKIDRFIENILPVQKNASYRNIPERSISSVWTNALVIFLLYYTTLWNLQKLRYIPIQLSTRSESLGLFIGIHQHWGMFAPSVYKNDGWYIIEGIKKDSSSTDIRYPGRLLSYEKPEKLVSSFANDRERKYSENLLRQDYQSHRALYCRYWKNKWDQENSSPIDHVRIVYMKEYTLPNYQPSIPVKEILCECQ